MVDNRDNDSGVGENPALEELVPTYNEKSSEYIDVPRKPDTLFLYFVAITAIVLLFVCSVHHVWASPVVPKLESNDTDINPLGRPITTIETSLLAGLPFLVSLIGSLFVGNIADMIGRKKTMLYMAITILICTVIVAFSNDITVYIIARCIIFVQFSATLVLLPVYLLEICEDHNRAKFGCLMGLGLPGGHLYSYVIGSISTVTVFTLLCGVPIIPYLLLFWMYAPESPVYLISRGEKDAAMRVLEKLQNNKSPQEIEREYNNIHETIKIKYNAERVGFKTILRSHTSRKSLVIALVPIMVQHCSGVSVIMQFMAPIFNEAGTYLSGNTISVIAGILKITIFFSTAMIVEKLGRRPLLLVSAFLTGITLFFLGLYFYWKYTNWIYLDRVQWLPILCLIANLMTYSIGLGPVPMAIMSEMFPGRTRAVGMSLVITLNEVVIFLLNFLFPIIAKSFGIHCCIWFFSGCCFVGTILIYYFLPETRGKSIVEIQGIIKK